MVPCVRSGGRACFHTFNLNSGPPSRQEHGAPSFLTLRLTFTGICRMFACTSPDCDLRAHASGETHEACTRPSAENHIENSPLEPPILRDRCYITITCICQADLSGWCRNPNPPRADVALAGVYAARAPRPLHGASALLPQNAALESRRSLKCAIYIVHLG